MNKFTKEETKTLTSATNALHQNKQVDNFFVGDDFAQVDFDCYEIIVTVPMSGIYKFELFDSNDDTLMESIATDATEEVPVRRMIAALFGIPQLRAFRNGWDGYTTQEGNDW